MRLLPCGPRAWLLETDRDDVLGYARAIEAQAHPAVSEVVPAARTLLVQLHDGAPTAAIGTWLSTIEPRGTGLRADHPAVRVIVHYDGDDLAAVAAACGMTTDDVVARHAGGDYVCAFCGFAPGFAYLRGLDPALRLPRRSTPRTRVPAGAVAIADEYSAVYPSVSPGGWHLLGRTDATMWDPTRDPPAMITPGTRVRFVAA